RHACAKLIALFHCFTFNCIVNILIGIQEANILAAQLRTEGNPACLRILVSRYVFIQRDLIISIAQLQRELDVKQAEADSLVTTVETQVDRMLSSMKGDLVHLEQEISEKIAAGNQEEAKKLAEVLAKVSESIEELKESLAEDPDALSLEEVRRELSDKIHSENVRAYRNLTDTVKELDHAEDMNVSMEMRFQSLRKRYTVTTVLLILEFVALVFVLLGVFHVISF
ncbi:MAG: hypothetical protein IIT72_00240, partial [Lachnospiraceae bacterium]|nr:hypothetical protein [Lachnospiraceae bacterium]